MKKINKVTRFFPVFADLLSILSFFGYSSLSLVKNLNYLINSPWWLKTIAFLAFLLLLRFAKNQILYVKNTIDAINAKDDLQAIDRLTSVKDVQSALPSTETLEYLLKNTERRALTWAEDATVTSINLYLSYTNGSWELPSFQTMYYSDWKKEQGVFYEGFMSTERYKELEDSETSVRPFFQINKDWKLVVSKAFNAVSSHIPGNCVIAIQDGGNGYSITITYKLGNLEKSRRFTLNEEFKFIKDA
jgi:hypothetical protein